MRNQESESIINKIDDYIRGRKTGGSKEIFYKAFEEIFAQSIDGKRLDSSIGVASIVKGKKAWAIYTVMVSNPLTASTVPVMVGRCCPDYSYYISDTQVDVEKTGNAVMNIWNERIYTSFDYYKHVNKVVLIYSTDYSSFCLFEEDIHRYSSHEYVWHADSTGKLIGRSIHTGEMKFSWQPIGSCFTIHEVIPKNSLRFTLVNSVIQ